MNDHESSQQPAFGRLMIGALLGALLGVGFFGGAAHQFGLPSQVFLFIGGLFGFGIGLSLTAILAQARNNTGL